MSSDTTPASDGPEMPDLTVPGHSSERASEAFDALPGDSEAEVDYSSHGTATISETGPLKAAPIKGVLMDVDDRPEVNVTMWITLSNGSRICIDETWPLDDRNPAERKDDGMNSIVDEFETVRELISSVNDLAQRRFRM